MGSYKGQITLINVNDGPPGSGIGIKKSEVFYVASSSGTNPPEDGWLETIPKVSQGQFLWTKNVLTFTDGSTQTSYQVSYQGLDGDEADASATYTLRFNQEEILKFYNSSNQLALSPTQLEIKLYGTSHGSEDGEVLIENLQIENFKLSIYGSTEQAQIPIDNSILSLGGINNSVVFVDLSKLTSNVEEPFVQASDIFISNESIITIEYIHQDISGNYFKTIGYINERFGLNKDMAQLSINANGIVAAIQNTKISFSANGIGISNGGLFIENNQSERVLYADDDGNLIIKGTIQADSGYFKGDITGATGTFSGRLEASEGFFSGTLQGASGSFSGNITATSGNIGGFLIGETQLTSKAVDEAGIPYIILNGEDGLIEAENIILGTGATIREYIQIGQNVQLRNAISDETSFISVTRDNSEILSLKANGRLQVGYGNNLISINGADGTIVSSNYIDGLGWKLSNDESIFNDVTIRGSIKASVIEYGESQAIGGTILVRPSSRIKQIEQLENTTYLWVENAIGFKTGDICLIDFGSTKNYYQILAIEDNRLEFSGILPTTCVSYPIISFGSEGTVGISINGSEDASLAVPSSISVFEFSELQKQLIPKIVLGRLPKEEQYGYAGGTYGLYAENVLLKGSLVTQTSTEDNSITYSGISTLYSGPDAPTSGRYSEWFGENTGEILLWAGASGTSKEQVENSKFFVDRHGNLFAGSGYFKGTIITDATITASEIQTAVLTGAGDSPALIIKDAKKGILFKAKMDDESEETDVFKLADYEITAKVNAIDFNSFKIKSDGSGIIPELAVSTQVAQAYADDSAVKGLIIQNNRILFTNSFKENENTGNFNSYISFENGLIFSSDGVSETLTISSQQTNIANQLNIAEKVRYGDLIEYRPVYDGLEIIGYDLYVE